MESDNSKLEQDLSMKEDNNNNYKNAINELLEKFSEEEIKDMYIFGEIFEMKIGESDANGDKSWRRNLN